MQHSNPMRMATLDSNMKQPPSCNPWQARLKIFTTRALGSAAALPLWQKYHALFQADYQALISPRHALNDILQLERVFSHADEPVCLLKPQPDYPHYRLHFYTRQTRYLDEFIPVLENMGLRVIDQVPFVFSVNGMLANIKSFTVIPAFPQCPGLSLIRGPLLDAISVVMAGRAENDALNKLCVLTGLDWQACDVLRAYRNYYLQLGHRSTGASVHRALTNNPGVALALYQYFDVRFRPNPDWQEAAIREELALSPLRVRLLDTLATVADINDDRILRTLFNLVDATVRCNFHQRRDADDYFIAFKIQGLGVIDMPAPKPYCEIYVHATDMEGIHLRGGKISRGGIRWSDRPDDFRTEILGLMQTQINKNALIIPTGAKGGFVIKGNAGRQDIKTAGKRAYQRLIRGLLDLTDNLADNTVLSPKNLVTYDDPDPYLVVAADKGTALFSDSANAIASEYGFWLGDAFASGGSHGYDHKALGITARGAWVCIQRHFQELGKDIQRQAFTVVGIGSMDGDVFGNAMLLSPCIRLLAAISGQHIFIDPTPPDSDIAFQERRRLFSLPASSWANYNPGLISKGGGVYPRSAKDIPVTAELKRWLGIRYTSIDGETLIRALLMSPVELLWLGGIGTYVKASSEKHEEVGDRANDNVRVDACDLAAKVVGEGANLGFTQQARIEFGLRGGLINTDAVDNSAGVDTSDHEVNLKILLNSLQKKQQLVDYQILFTEMTDAVCQLVLANNAAQSLCLSLEQLRCADNATPFLQLADRLEAAGVLDRTLENFAASKDILARPKQTITRPELATLMAASKMYLTQQIQGQAEILHDDCYQPYGHHYFPAQLRDRFGAYLSGHALAAEIKATVISNRIVNQAGCGFLTWVFSIGGSIMVAIDSYLAFEQILQADTLRLAVEQDKQLPAVQKHLLLDRLEHTLLGLCRWSLAHSRPIRPDNATVTYYRDYLNRYETVISPRPATQTEGYTAQQTPASFPVGLSQKWHLLTHLQNFPYLVLLAEETQQEFTVVLPLLEAVYHTLAIEDIQQQIAAIPLRDSWEATVVSDLQEDLQQCAGQLTKKILASPFKTCEGYFAQAEMQRRLKNYQRLYLDSQQALPHALPPYVVLVRGMSGIAGDR